MKNKGKGDGGGGRCCFSWGSQGRLLGGGAFQQRPEEAKEGATQIAGGVAGAKALRRRSQLGLLQVSKEDSVCVKVTGRTELRVVGG